jgi:hypothetical protein
VSSQNKIRWLRKELVKVLLDKESDALSGMFHNMAQKVKDSSSSMLEKDDEPANGTAKRPQHSTAGKGSSHLQVHFDISSCQVFWNNCFYQH